MPLPPAPLSPGWIAFFGSGETSPTGSKIFQNLAARLTPPLRAAILETPAGFELNSAQVAGRVADFLKICLQNYQPAITVVPARQRHTPFSPDAPDIVAPLETANLIFMGAGSPTYAVRQLQASLAWQIVQIRHRLGAGLALASAATLAAGTYVLPVYEIYKAGEALHWRAGLNLLGPYGLSLVIVPHWNNTDGGAELDTSHCFMGAARFVLLQAQLPADQTIVGIDEHTALILDLGHARAEVLGNGSITVLTQAQTRQWCSPAQFALAELGNYHRPETHTDLPEALWAQALNRPQPQAGPDEAVLKLVAERETARQRKDWSAADDLRVQIAAQGWQVKDTPAGPVVEPNPPAAS